ncbi:hypothetical protein BZA05DRAFT_470147 [Tricharina praecox]|uniref:uncharacterized protein n=1 Tax=Tricharina praecox TaxID=43433 RepID=UPI00221EC23D|nr:uncharacterized protein BZA05DRAFT_470147 [Tricharina praecox]KAI5858922.1 hypothetical protein BZA05DRAFT_470147 [Tricharina praecox]
MTPSTIHLLTASLLLLLQPLADSCGVLVHNQIVHRSGHIFALPNSLPQFHAPQKVFSPLVTAAANAASVQAGAFFPDWGYQCLQTDELAEAAHWPPFLIAAVEHITSKYGFLNGTEAGGTGRTRSRSEDEQKHLESLVAFVFAVASHQTADATWHAIRLPTGFLAALAGIDFGGNVAEAHQTLDVGGDFIAAARLARLPQESSAWIENSWQMPVGDLVQIYERMGLRVSKWGLRYCTMRGLAALRSELALGGRLFEKFAATSPMLVDEMDGYYLGGIDEMTARTVNCWANLTRWFSDGISEEDKLSAGWNICDVFQAIRARGGAGKMAPPHTHQFRHNILDDDSLYAATLREMEEMDVKTDRFGAETFNLPRKLEQVRTLPRRPAEKYSLPFDDRIYVATYVPYGHMGASISAGYFSTDPEELAFAVGAPWESEDSSRPGEGNVYVIPNSFISGSLTQSSTHNLRINSTRSKGLHDASSLTVRGVGSSVDQRFGTASTSLKALNRTFLAVSAPGPLTCDGARPPSLPFHPQALAGRVELFIPGDGESQFTFSRQGAELGSIGTRQWGDHLLSAALHPDSDEEFLIVSASSSDRERACNGRERPQFGEGEVAIIRLRYATSEDDVVSDNHRSPLILAQQHNAINNTCISEDRIGVTSCYSLHEARGEGVVADMFGLYLPESERDRIPCDRQTTYARFGTSIAFSSGSKLLWISAPGRGKVFGYRFSPDEPAKLVTTIADEDFALRPQRTGFGHSLATGMLPDGREWIAVSAPNEEVDDSKQVGVVRIYQITTTSTGTNTPEIKLVHEVIPSDPAGYTKFGRSLAADADSRLLWIGSEFAGEERGAVWAVEIGNGEMLTGQSTASTARSWMELVLSKLPFLPRDTEDDKRIRAKVVWEGAEPGERFGATIVAAAGDVAVGVPFAGIGKVPQEENFFGAMAVFRRRKANSEEL